MKKTAKKSAPVPAETIARMADRGENIMSFFKGEGRMVRPLPAEHVQRVNLDLTASMLQELDNAARGLNVSRQAVIKTFVRQALDQHYLAGQARKHG